MLSMLWAALAELAAMNVWHACVCLPHQIGPQDYRCSARGRNLPLYTCITSQDAEPSRTFHGGENTRGRQTHPNRLTIFRPSGMYFLAYKHIAQWLAEVH